MPYIGQQPATSFHSLVKQDFSVSATTSYTLSQSVTSANDIALFINNVRQEPTTAYSASGTSLTLTEATAGSDDMYCVYIGRAVGTINPASGSVGTSQIVDTAVTGSKINTDAISAQTELTTEPADTDEFLVSDSGVLKRMDYSLIKTEGTTAKAWVNFNGTGTVAIRASQNVSSITDNSSGYYTINLTSAMADANGAAFVNSSKGTPNGDMVDHEECYINSASTIQVTSYNGGFQDAAYIYVGLFR